MTSESSRHGVLDAGFRLIDTVAAVPEGLGVTELARATGLPKTTTHRLAGQLVEAGALERVGHRYVVGDAVLRWGKSRPAASRLYRAAYLPVRRLGQLSGALAGVVEDGADGPGVVVEYSRDGVPFAIDPASPLWPRTAVARLFAADAGQPQQVAYDRGEVIPGLSCVAVSLQLDGQLPAALAALYFQPDLPPAASSMVVAASRTIRRNWASSVAVTA